MTLAAFPTDHVPPQPAPEGLVITFANFCNHRAREIGPARQRRTADIASHFVDNPMQLTNKQYEYLRAWAEYSLHGAADWFTMSLFLGSDYSSVTTRIVAGSVQPRRNEGGWLVTPKLEVTDMPTLSADALTAIIGAAGSGLPAWPTGQLDYHTLDDEFGHVLGQALLRGEEAGATPDQVHFTTVMPSEIPFAWAFSWTDFETFKAWLKWRLSWGNKWLTLPVFRGASYETNTARFVAGSITATRDGPEWVVRGSLELRELAPLTLTAAAAL